MIGLLTGRLTPIGQLTGVIERISDGGGSDVPIYEGEYEVTPRLTEQVLETQYTELLDNVTIHEIPITRTSNPQDGLTVLIG